MREIKEMLSAFAAICGAPRARLDRALASGRKAVGVLPYFCPEELAYAAGLLPFGVWGRDGQVSEAKRYFPPFICSILQTALDMGIKGELDGLSAVMIPVCCDSLKCMGSNWECGVKSIPVINVAYAQNRKTAAGEEFTVSQFRKILRRLEEIAGRGVSDGDIADAVAVYNGNRAALSGFTAAAAGHPETVTPTERCAVIKAGMFMDRREHTAAVKELTEALNALPETPWRGLRVVTTGILADSPELLAILEENGMAVAADQVAAESVGFRVQTPVTEDPLLGMARRLGRTEGASVLFDPGKRRGAELVELAKSSGADGVVWIMTKFCDPEEYDFVPVKRMLDAAGIPLLTLEADRQTPGGGQAASAAQAFRERLEGMK